MATMLAWVRRASGLLAGSPLLLILAAAPAIASPDRVYWNDFEPAISAADETWTWIPFDEPSALTARVSASA